MPRLRAFASFGLLVMTAIPVALLLSFLLGAGWSALLSWEILALLALILPLVGIPATVFFFSLSDWRAHRAASRDSRT